MTEQSHWWFYYAERGEGVLPDRNRQWEMLRELNDRLAALEAKKPRKPQQRDRGDQ